jgi:hypothetical protein
MPEVGGALTEGGRVPAGTIIDASPITTASPRVRVMVGRRLPEGRLVARVDIARDDIIFIVSPEAHRRPAQFLQELENLMQEAADQRARILSLLIPTQNMPTE